MSHEFRLENMTLRGLFFWICKEKITLNRFKDHFLDLPLVSKAIYLLSKASAPKANSPPLSPFSWDSLIPLHPHPSLISINTFLCQSFPLLVGDFFDGLCCPQQKSEESWGNLECWNFGAILGGILWPHHPRFTSLCKLPYWTPGYWKEVLTKEIPKPKKGLKSLLWAKGLGVSPRSKISRDLRWCFGEQQFCSWFYTLESKEKLKKAYMKSIGGRWRKWKKAKQGNL